IALALFYVGVRLPTRSTLFPYTTLFRSRRSSTSGSAPPWTRCSACSTSAWSWARSRSRGGTYTMGDELLCTVAAGVGTVTLNRRSEEHTSELQSRFDLVCRLLLEKKKLL